jgi:hypothetical protein
MDNPSTIESRTFMNNHIGVPGIAACRPKSVQQLRTASTRRIKLASPALSIAVLLALSGCAKETLFQSNFDPTPVNQPPAVAQQVGTAQIHGPAGSVIVIPPPVQPSGKWVQISRPSADSDVAGFQGNCMAFRGDGQYTFSTTVFMPPGAGVATIQFEPFGQPVSSLTSFLHLDLMPNNQVRIDDDENTKFGLFPRGQAFIVQVTLDINASPSAHIVLSGAGAEGSADRTITPALVGMARQFGAVRLWMGFPHTGAFDATNIVVSRKQD